MTAEEWRPVVGWAMYEVSNLGRVASLWTGRYILRTPQDAKHPYARVSLRRDGRTTERLVHQLVVEAFHGPRPHQAAVCRHLDGDRFNNSAANLRWGTSSQNARDRLRHGTDAMARKTHCKNGHEFTAANTYRGQGHRSCFTCRRANSLASYYRRRALAT